MMDCSTYQENIALHALDALGPEEIRALEAHLSTCPSCQADYLTMRQAAGSLGYAAPAVPLPATLKGRLMARIQEEVSAAPVRPLAPVVPVPDRRARFWQAASLVLGAGLLAALAGLTAVNQQLAAEQSRNQALAFQLAEANDRLAVLRSRDVQMAALAGQDTARQAVARIFWSPEKKAWLMTVVGLPQAAAGKTYQLWAVTPDAKVSMGTFQTDPEGGAVIETTLELPAKPVAAAVSVEPVGGVPQPTGQIVLLGNI